MNTQKNDIERCAFVKGYNIIRARRKGRDLASIAMDEISQALKVTLFLADDTRNSAIAGLVWLVGFGGFSMLRERYRSRDLKAALEHKE